MKVNFKEIGLRALVTAVEAFLAALFAAGTTELDADAAELAVIAAVGAGLSVIYNACRAWLDSRSYPPVGTTASALHSEQPVAPVVPSVPHAGDLDVHDEPL